LGTCECQNLGYRRHHVGFAKSKGAWQASPGVGTPYNGLYGEAPPERGTFFRLQVYKRVGILQAGVYERVGKSVI